MVQNQIPTILENKPDLKESIQNEIRECLTKKPQINNLEDLLDWKITVWEKQYETDDRIQALFNSLTRDQKDEFYDSIILNPYIPVVPFFTQILLLFTKGSVLYGGARGGGKTEASLIGALQYVDFPQWKAGIFRLTFSDLSVPGAIMDRALDWLDDNPILKEAEIAPKWNKEKKTFTFPSGAKIKFGHVQHDKDAEKYQGSEFHLLVIDEAVQFTENKITRLKGSNRKQINDPLPLRIWFTGNPGGVSHDYFKERFIDGPGFFIDSKYTDNPYLNHKKYEEIFIEIQDSDPILYRQWKEGDWNAIPEGKLYKRKWFTGKNGGRLYEFITEKIIQWIRFWDLAATEEANENKKGGPDWTVGMLLGLGESGKVYLEDIVRFRKDPDEAEEEILRTAEMDEAKYGRKNLKIRIEQEGGASAKYVMNTFAGKLPGFDFEGRPVQRKSKIDRARAFVSFIKHGHFKTKQGSTWITTFLNEIASFPTKGIHDDQVDTLSGGLHELFYGEEEERYPEGINPFKIFKA